MNQNRLIMPYFNGNFMVPQNVRLLPRNIGLFSKINNGFQHISWAKLLNGANKTLNVMNQTIPLIKQSWPMFNNIKNMLRLAKAFRNETDQTNYTNNKEIISENKKIIYNYHDDDFPTFFV